MLLGVASGEQECPDLAVVDEDHKHNEISDTPSQKKNLLNGLTGSGDGSHIATVSSVSLCLEKIGFQWEGKKMRLRECEGRVNLVMLASKNAPCAERHAKCIG